MGSITLSPKLPSNILNYIAFHLFKEGWDTFTERKLDEFGGKLCGSQEDFCRFYYLKIEEKEKKFHKRGKVNFG